MGDFQFPWDTGPAPAASAAATEQPPEETSEQPKPRGRRPAAVTRVALAASDAAPDWLYHHLKVSGPAETVAAFAAAARGAGISPWPLDGAAIEEDVFVRAVSQPAATRTLTVEGCRILARQFRDRVERHQARAAALVGQSRACPFDLQVLLPVPELILRLGPAHPAALAWLTAHCVTTDRLRQVAVREKATAGRRLPRGHSVIGYGFFTYGQTPLAAVTTLAARWPALRLALVPRPAG